MKTEQLSFASINEAVEIEYNSFCSIIESISILNESDILNKENFKNAGKAIIEKLKLLWTKIKRWIAAIKIKLITYFKNVIVRKAEAVISNVEKAVKDNKLADIKSYKMAVLVTNNIDKKEKEVNLDSASFKSKFDATRNVISTFKTILDKLKFIISEADIKKLNKNEIIDKIKDNIPSYDIDNEEIVIDDINEVTDSQDELKDFVKDILNDKKSFPLLHCTINADHNDNGFIINAFKMRLNNAKDLANELETDYSKLLEKQKYFEKGYNKVIDIIGSAKGNKDFVNYGGWLRDDINSIKLAASVICGFFVGLIKEVVYNGISLASILNGETGEEIKKEASKNSKDANDRLNNLEENMRKESKTA